MARPRESNRHLPKYVYEHHGAWWFRPPSGDNLRICEVGDYPTLYRFMADKLEPVSNADLTTLRKCFERYEREVLPTLAPRTQKDYRRALRVLDAVRYATVPGERGVCAYAPLAPATSRLGLSRRQVSAHCGQ